ncbi:MAG: SPOR domain-containing protein [Candidatus Ratteibacteria bacterium]|nr:SPOR domain-containing protein [Candidatus Ratteibacteria bacterium]
MTKIGLIVFLIVFSATAVFAAVSSEEKSFQNIKKVIDEGKIETAAEAAKTFIRRFPESGYLPEIKFFLAESESSFYKALKKYEAIVKLYPRSRYACLSQVRIAEHYFTLGNFRQARISWRKYLKLFPGGEEADIASLSIGSCYYQEKRFNKAIGCLKGFLDSYPESFYLPRARFNLASAYLNRGKIDEAGTELEGLLKDYPDWENKAAVYRKLSDVYLEKGENKKSREIMAKLKVEFPRALDIKGGSYSIQVGAFSEKGRAEKLARRLEKKGYDAYLTSAVKKGVTFYRVRIGRFGSEAEAGEMAGKIEAKENLPGIVISK